MYTTPIKVRGYHLDVYGHVNNARYLEFLEEGRWALFESVTDLNAWAERGYAFVVVNINISYRRAAKLHDELALTTQLAELGSRSGVLEQVIRRDSDGEVVADAKVTFVVIDAKIERAIPIEGELRTALLKMQGDE